MHTRNYRLLTRNYGVLTRNYRVRETIAYSRETIACSRETFRVGNEKLFWAQALQFPVASLLPSYKEDLSSWDTERVLHLDKERIWEKAFFLLNWSLFQSRSETARLLVRAVVKNEPMGRQRSCTNLWRRFPPRIPPDPAKMGGESGYISGSFRHRILRLLRLKRRLSRAATWHGKVRSTRSVSQGTEVTTVTEYVPCRYSTRTASW